MKRWVFLTGMALCLPGLAGCLSQTTRIKLKPDGSGTLEITQVLGPRMTATLRQLRAAAALAKESGRPAPDLPNPVPYGEEPAKAQAKTMGPGVSFLRGEKIKTKETEGYRAFYAFKDINTLKLNERPEPPFASSGGQAGEWVAFRMKKNEDGAYALGVFFPLSKEEKARAVPPAMLPRLRQSLKQSLGLLKGSRIVLELEVEGREVKANTPHIEGSKITLFDLNFDALADPPLELKQLPQGEPGIEMAKRLLRGRKGCKVHPKTPVKITFQAP